MKKRIPETLNEFEIKALLSQPNKRARTGLRDLAMMHLMLNAGLRASEVLSITARDIDWTSGKLRIRRGKGDKDRIVWLNEDDLDTLRSWREKKPKSELLFTTLDGERINDRYLRAMIKRRARKAGITKDVHPHTLRHTFATDLYRNTRNIRLVQKALGHSDLSTTMIYTHIHDEELESAMKSFRVRSRG
jgi:integrase/recombinase XerD